MRTAVKTALVVGVQFVDSPGRPVRRYSRLGQRSSIAYEMALGSTSTTLTSAAYPVSKIPGQGPHERAVHVG